jgi:hypothetical protein
LRGRSKWTGSMRLVSQIRYTIQGHIRITSRSSTSEIQMERVPCRPIGKGRSLGVRSLQLVKLCGNRRLKVWVKGAKMEVLCHLEEWNRILWSRTLRWCYRISMDLLKTLSPTLLLRLISIVTLHNRNCSRMLMEYHSILSSPSNCCNSSLVRQTWIINNNNSHRMSIKWCQARVSLTCLLIR